MRSKDLQLRLLYPAKLLFRIKGQIKSFPNKKKLKDFITTKAVLCEMLKGILEGGGGGGEEEKDKNYEQWNGNKYLSINN